MVVIHPVHAHHLQQVQVKMIVQLSIPIVNPELQALLLYLLALAIVNGGGMLLMADGKVWETFVIHVSILVLAFHLQYLEMLIVFLPKHPASGRFRLQLLQHKILIHVEIVIPHQRSLLQHLQLLHAVHVNILVNGAFMFTVKDVMSGN